MFCTVASNEKTQTVLEDMLTHYGLALDRHLDDKNAAYAHVKRVEAIKKCSSYMKKLKSIDEVMKQSMISTIAIKDPFMKHKHKDFMED
jgi:hypothetical protein